MNSGRRALGWTACALLLAATGCETTSGTAAPLFPTTTTRPATTTAAPTTTVAPSTTSTTVAAPVTTTTTIPYVEGTGTELVSWGFPFTVIGQGVPPVDDSVLRSLVQAQQAPTPCPAGAAITQTGRLLASSGSPSDSKQPAGAREAVALPGGGFVYTTVDAVVAGQPDVVNAAYVDRAGTVTRLTNYQPSLFNAGRRQMIVGDLRLAASGRVFASLQQLPPARARTQNHTTELVIDPATRTISAVATGPGILLFDEDASGAPLVGAARPGAIEWRHQDGSPMTGPTCEAAA